MDRVFICYSRKDFDFVDRVTADLRAVGVSVWRDIDDIPGHIAANTSSWRDAVDEGLRQCSHMIVFLSPDSVKSKEVKAEWNYFLTQDRPIYPVQMEDCEISYRLLALNVWDFRSNYAQQLGKLIPLLPTTSEAPSSSSPGIAGLFGTADAPINQ